jgi:RNA recognition motif-containing protein
MSIKLYVGGLSYNTTEEQLNAMFAEHGKVLSAKIITDRDTGNSKGFGFVEMEEMKDGQAAIKALNGKDVDGRSLTVNQARPQGERRPNYSGGYRR